MLFLLPFSIPGIALHSLKMCSVHPWHHWLDLLVCVLKKVEIISLFQHHNEYRVKQNKRTEFRNIAISSVLSIGVERLLNWTRRVMDAQNLIRDILPN